MQPHSSPGRTPGIAVQRFVELIQLQISCVSSAVVGVGGGYFVASSPHTLTLPGGELMHLRGPAQLRMRVTQQYEIVSTGSPEGSFDIELRGYAFGVYGANERELFAYQWHPSSLSHVQFPHLHLGPGSMVRRAELQRSHLPTGYVELRQVLRLLIEEFDVIPMRDDWDDILG